MRKKLSENTGIEILETDSTMKYNRHFCVRPIIKGGGGAYYTAYRRNLCNYKCKCEVPQKKLTLLGASYFYS